MRRALFGGSFDPFHNGHLAVVRALQDRDICDRLVLVPATLSPGKPPPLADGRHREAMALLGVSGQAYVSVLDLELRRPGPSYTVDTLTALTRMHPDDDWLLVVGSDAWCDFRTWRDPDRVLELAQVVVFPRPGSEPDPRTLRPPVSLLEDFRVTVSSSDVRRRLVEGRAVDGLVPAPVLDYIRDHDLYAAAGGLDGGDEPCR